MLNIEYSGQFKKDIKKLKKRGKELEKIKEPIELILNDSILPLIYKDHALVGNWAGCRDLHVEPDWVLIYVSVRLNPSINN